MAAKPMHATLTWKNGLLFEGAAGERHLLLDGESRAGCSPMESLLMSLAGCMAIDIVHILGKMRAPLKSIFAEIEGLRAETEPRRFTRITLRFTLEGEGVEAAAVDRAIALSRDKYCSVYHSLAADIQVETTYELNP